MKTKLTLILVIICNLTLRSQGISLSLKEAIDISLTQNENIKQSYEKLKQKEFANKSAWGNFLPSVNYNISYNNLNDPLSIDLSPIKNVIVSLQSSNQAEIANISNLIGSGSQLTTEQKKLIYNSAFNNLYAVLPEFKQTIKDKQYLSGGLNFVQPIFMGGKILAAKHAASAELAASEYELKKTQNETISEVIDLYIQSYVLSEAVKTRKAYLEGIKNHKINAEKLFTEGIIANNQYLRAIVAVDEAEQKLFDEENNYSLSLLALKFKLNLPESTKFHLSDSLSLFLTDDLPDETFENQPIIKILDEKQKLAEENYKAIQSSFLPSIYAFGKYEIFPQYLSALEPRWILGIQLNYNLFNGFKDIEKLQEAKSLKNEVTFKRNEISNNLRLLYTKSLNEINSTKMKYEKLSSSIESAKENLRQNLKRFETGLGNSLDVIDAQLYLQKIELDKLTAIYSYYKALNQYSYVLGKPELFLNTFYNKEN